MLKRILVVWLIANFALIGAASWLAGGWYPRWPLALGTWRCPWPSWG